MIVAVDVNGLTMPTATGHGSMLIGVLVGFLIGCLVATAAVSYLGDWAWSLPVALAALAIAVR